MQAARTILLVEDSLDLARLVQRELQSQGYRVQGQALLFISAVDALYSAFRLPLWPTKPYLLIGGG